MRWWNRRDFGTPRQKSSSDAETLQLSMDANVLAVASGGGAGKSQQANRPPHGGTDRRVC